MHEAPCEQWSDAAPSGGAHPPSSRLHLSIAGIDIEYDIKLSEAFRFELALPYQVFESHARRAELQVVVDSRSSLCPSSGSLICKSGGSWVVRRKRERPIFEFYHPPSSRLLMSVAMQEDPLLCEVLFDEGNWRWFWRSNGSPKESRLPVHVSHPLDQLIFVSAAARLSGFLLHAGGAVVDGKAFVFAGHSGDGKSTLSRILASEGLELLSDERIVIRKVDGAFMAYGTPWPGEGGIVSPAGYPLAGVFLLRKAKRHHIREGCPSGLVAGLLSRAIVPYFLRDETERILALVQDLSCSLPLRELEFAPEPGLAPLLLQEV